MLRNRVLRLESIGFEFDPSKNNWMLMYRRPCSYKEEHRATTVPPTYTKDPSLGKWVNTQRNYCKKKERVKLLDDIDFVWDARQ